MSAFRRTTAFIQQCVVLSQQPHLSSATAPQLVSPRCGPCACSFTQGLKMALTSKRRSFLAWLDDRPAGSTVTTCAHNELSHCTPSRDQHTQEKRSCCYVSQQFCHKRCRCEAYTCAGAHAISVCEHHLQGAALPLRDSRMRVWRACAPQAPQPRLSAQGQECASSLERCRLGPEHR